LEVDPPRFERCYCTGVDRDLAIAGIRRAGCTTFDEARRASGACYGCQSCRPEFERLLEELRASADQPTQRLSAWSAEVGDDPAGGRSR
jgi:NAD(P)H-nitrite reductase large subunit